MPDNRDKRDFLDGCARITRGSLRLRTPEGHLHIFGAGHPQAELVLHDWSVLAAVAARGQAGLCDSFVAGHWQTASVEHLAMVLLGNRHSLSGQAGPGFWHRMKAFLLDRVRRLRPGWGVGRTGRPGPHVAGTEFFQLLLDDSMTYSAALFAPGDPDLNRAQMRKYDRILDRAPGARVLEVGCGWGGFAERASEAGRDVTGITRSLSLKGYADARLDGRALIQMRDLRSVEGRFDAIVSIETADLDRKSVV